MDADITFVPELCVVRPAVTSAPQLLTLLARMAITQGYAYHSFEEALLAREREFPTGLPTQTPVAIPHTDCAHVRRPALAAALLDPPLPFGEMGGAADKVVLARLAVVLLVSDPSTQVGVLSRLMTALQRPGWAEPLDHVTDPAHLASLLRDLLSDIPA